jgi:NTE family protein
VRVGLVLGAGGVLGGAWLVGGLRALERATGWAGHRADLVVGTSSGALIGALVTAGIPASDLLSAQGTRIMAEVVAAEGVPGLGVDLLETIARYRTCWAATAPGSWPLARAELRNPRPRHLLKVVSGLLPAGSVSTGGIQALVRRWAPEGWPARPQFRVVACDYETGERVAFGRAASPELARAVGASCAMPSYYRPVLVGGRTYVDGAIHSATNLDLLRGAGMDLAVVLSPLSSRAAVQRTTLGRIVAGGRRQLSRRLEREAALVRAAGTRVLVLEPTVDDLVARGERRRTAERVDELARLAERTVAQQLARPANRVLVDQLRAHQPLHEIA